MAASLMEKAGHVFFHLLFLSQNYCEHVKSFSNVGSPHGRLFKRTLFRYCVVTERNAGGITIKQMYIVHVLLGAFLGRT